MNTTSSSCIRPATLLFILITFITYQPTLKAQTRPSAQLEVVARLDFRPGNVAVSRHGRVFATAHPLSTSTFQDPRLNWPDNLALAPTGYLYISVNQLNTTPAFTGDKDLGAAPYYIYRFKYN